jgi:hypothetical protein
MVCLSVCLSVCPCPNHLSLGLSMPLSLHPTSGMTGCPVQYLSSFHLSVCLSVCLSVHSSVRRSVCLCLSACPFECCPIYPSQLWRTPFDSFAGALLSASSERCLATPTSPR